MLLPVIFASVAALGIGVVVGKGVAERKDPPHLPESPLSEDFRPLTQTEHRTAVHEVGHTIASWNNPYVRRIKRVQIHTRGGDISTETISRGGGVKALWYDLVVDLGGFAAEMAEFSKSQSGPCKQDLSKAKRRADKIVQLHGNTRHPWKFSGDLPFDLGQVFRNTKPETIRVMNIAYARARKLYTKDPLRTTHLVRLLAERRTLKESELRQVFGRRVTSRSRLGLQYPCRS